MRDGASGLVVLPIMAWVGPRVVGIVLQVEAPMPMGDMSTILAADGSKARAFGIHGSTAALMIAGASR